MISQAKYSLRMVAGTKLSAEFDSFTANLARQKAETIVQSLNAYAAQVMSNI